MLRLFSLVGVAFLAAAAIAMTTPAPTKVVRRERRPADPGEHPGNPRTTQPLPTMPLYYAGFSLN